MIHIIVFQGRGNIISIKLLISTRVAKTIKYIYCSSDTRVFFPGLKGTEGCSKFQQVKYPTSYKNRSKSESK